MLLLLASLAFAEDLGAVEAGKVFELKGPAVWMLEDKYRAYVKDSRNLPVCQEKLETAVQKAVEANERAIEARDIAKREFALADEEDAVQVQTIAELAVRVDDLAAKNARLKEQRNVAWGIAGGFLSAATAAVVLTLN
jgi:hypothetical protein